MRSKMEFEARVRELAAQKREANLKKQHRIRTFTIVGGVVVCAACCAIVFTRMNGINIIKSSSDKKYESSGADYMPDDNRQELATEAIMNNRPPEAAGDKNAMENDAISDESMENGEIKADSISIMRVESISDSDARAVLLDGDNDKAVELITMLEELEVMEASDGKTSEAEITYEIKIWQGQNIHLLIIEDNNINKDGTWYSFSEEDEAVLNVILDKCFE